MHVCDLPNDILHQIFVKTCAQMHHCAVRRYKRDLPLLAVCRRWRYVALPVVHSKVFLQCIVSEEIRKYNISIGGEPVNTSVLTNLGFAVSAGYMRAVKELSIYIYYDATPITGLDTVVAMMRAAAERWGETRALEIVLCMELPASEENKAEVAEHEREAARVATALASVVPNVRQLDCSGLDPTQFAERIHGQLVSQYAGQLCKIRTSRPIAMPSDCILRRLRHATINCNSIEGRLPVRMDVTNLVFLRMTQVAENHLWSQFRTDSSSATIVFPSLTRLVIDYTGEDAVGDAEESAEPWRQDEAPQKLHFPRLKTMQVTGKHRICTLFSCMVLPARMDCVRIGVPTAALLSLSKTQLPVVNYLKVYIETSVDDRSDALTIANRAIERMQGSEMLELTIYQGSLNLPAEAICALLTHLEMYPYVGVDYMLALIRKLPRLASLTLWKLEFDDIQADISVPGPEEFCFVEPLSTSIRRLCLHTHQERQSPDMLVTLSKRLLLGVPTLSDFRMPCVPRRPVMDFVDAYSVWHPHLADIAFKLDDSHDAAEDPDGGRMHITTCLLS